MTDVDETAPAHTPGPWRVWDGIVELDAETNTGPPLIVAWDDRAEETADIAEVWQDSAEWIANARVIAAAPDLLEALRHAYRRLIDIPHDHADTDFELLREAMRRAGGDGA